MKQIVDIYLNILKKIYFWKRLWNFMNIFFYSVIIIENVFVYYIFIVRVMFSYSFDDFEIKRIKVQLYFKKN